MKNLIITGNHGTGKSFIAEHIAASFKSAVITTLHDISIKKSIKAFEKKMESPIDVLIIENFALKFQKNKAVRFLLNYKRINLIIVSHEPKNHFTLFKESKNFLFIETSE